MTEEGLDTDAFSDEQDGDVQLDIDAPDTDDEREFVNPTDDGIDTEPRNLPDADDGWDAVLRGDSESVEAETVEDTPDTDGDQDWHGTLPLGENATAGDDVEAPRNDDKDSEDDEDVVSGNETSGDCDGEDETMEVDTRGLNENPKTASPNVDPADVTVDGSVSTRVKARLNGEEAGSDVHGISQGKPTDDYVSLHVRLVRTYDALDDHGDLVGTIATVVGETGTTTVKVSDLLADVHDRLDPAVDADKNIEPGDEIVISGVEWSRDGEIGFEANRSTNVVRVESDEFPVGYWLEKASELDRLADIYEDAQNQPEAWNRIADVLVSELHIAIPHTKDGDDVWWLYIDDEDREDYGLWTPTGKSRVEALLSAHLPYKNNDSRHRREILRSVKQRCRVEPDEFAAGVPDDADLKWVVGVENGVVDLRNGKLHPHGPQWRLRSKVRTEYDPDAAQSPSVDALGPGLRRFVNDAAGDENDAKLLIDMVAHTLCRNHSVKAWFPVVGPTDSGKGWWVETMCEMLGDDLTSEINFPVFAGGEGFESGKIRDVHAVIDDDATRKKVKDISFLKKVTGGRGASINRKYERLEDYTPYSTIITLNNNPSVFDEEDNSVTNRIYPIELPHRHTDDPTDEHADFIPERELEAATRTDEELQQLLAVAVEAAGELYKTNEPRDDREEQERWDLYCEYADHSRTFFKTCMEEKLSAKLRKDAAHSTYVQMCHERDVDPMRPSDFWSECYNSKFISVERGKYVGDDRAVGSVMLTERAIEQYAPDWVVEEYEDEVETGGHVNPSDRVTDLSDLGWNRVGAVEARVKARDNVHRDDEKGVELLIEDEDAPMDLFENTNREFDPEVVEEAEVETDGVNVGDKVRVEYPRPERGPRGSMRLAVDAKTTVTVIEPGPLSTRDHTGDDEQQPLDAGQKDETNDDEQDTGDGEDGKDVERPVHVQFGDDTVVFMADEAATIRAAADKSATAVAGELDREPTDKTLEAIREVQATASDGDGESSQRDRVKSVKDVVESVEDVGEGGAAVEEVIDRLEANGFDAEKAEKELEKLKHRGEVYEVGAGRVRTT